MKRKNCLLSAFRNNMLKMLFVFALLPVNLYAVTVSTELTLKVGGDDGIIEIAPDDSYLYLNCVYQNGEPVYAPYVDVTTEDSKIIVHPKAAGSTGFTVVCQKTKYNVSIYVHSENSFTALTEEGVEMTFDIINESRKTCSTASHCISPSTTGKVTVPSEANGYTVISFGSYSFKGMSGITQLVFPDGLQSITNNFAFEGCTNLKSIYIPKTVTYLGYGLFAGCESLTSIVVDPENPFYDSRDNCNAIIETSSNAIISACPVTEIPLSVTAISYAAFQEIHNRESIYVPANITHIHSDAFAYCRDLKEIIFEKSIADMGTMVMGWNYSSLQKIKVFDENPCEIGESVFQSNYTATLYVPKGCIDKYKTTAGWQKFNNIIEMDVKLKADAEIVYTDEEPTLNIDLECREDAIMSEFYLRLPDGIEITTDENGNYDITLNPERVNDHVLEVVRNSEGVYHFFCYSPTNAPFIGETGNLMTVNLVHNENIGSGCFPAQLTSILFSDNKLNGISQDNISFNIQFKAFQLGDVNDDTRFNGLDLVEIVNHIMNRPSDHFVKHAADFDKNGVVNGMDLIEEVDLLLSQVETTGAKYREQKAEKFERPSIPLRLDNNGGNMSLAVESSDDFILAQFILQLNEGQTLNGIDTDMNHVVAYKAIGDNRYAVLCYSMRNEVFMSNDNVMNLSINGKGDVSVSDALFINADMKECWVGATYSGEATGITEIDSELRQPVNTYSVGGQLVRRNVSSLDDLPQGIYVINGKKYIKR